jgi:hypothetical protein
MPTPTYTLIDSVTLASSAASVTFSGISATGKGDLVLVVEYKADTITDLYSSIRFNNDPSNIYSVVYARGNGSSANSSTQVNTVMRDQNEASTTSPVLDVWQIMDYAATDKHKTVLLRGNGTGGVSAYGAVMLAGRYASTSAITQINYLFQGSAKAGSTLHLYQIVSE